MKKQVVPNSPEVEVAVLGALMSEPNMIDEIAGLNADLFFTPANAQVFGVIRDIRSAGGVPNIVAVTQVLASHDRLEFVGGAGAVTEMLANTAGGPAAVEYHVQTLRDLHARRAILNAAGRLQSAASDLSQPADDVLQDAGESVLSLSPRAVNRQHAPCQRYRACALGGTGKTHGSRGQARRGDRL
jgi:replicative DNA helicase